MKALGAAIVVAILSVTAVSAVCGGGESISRRTPTYVPGLTAQPIERSAIRPSAMVPRSAPSGAPYRPMCWGAECNEFYGPTYYYPSAKLYEGNHPQYYPFIHETKWPNYKAPAPETRQCGSSRSLWFWDSYDDWTRGGRYEERQ